uniref:Uncharacterized protein n=1 Tax=Arundo donax TaxID=35708 RepID=A0A0A9CRH6_ARUDO
MYQKTNLCPVWLHTLEVMHLGMVELRSTFCSSDSNKASTSISSASEASVNLLSSIMQPFSPRVTIMNLMLGNLESIDTNATGTDEAPVQTSGNFAEHTT